MRQKPIDLDTLLASYSHRKNVRTYHAKEVSGNARHAQKSTEANVFLFCEAISHCLNFATQSKPALFAMKTQPTASDAEESKKAEMVNVRG